MSSHEEAGFAKKRPISTHKAFAPILALWFAALLGLGSMVLPVAQIERLVLMTGISRYIPMVAPPLDMTGRAIVAVVLALLGGAIGQVIARRLSAAHSGLADDEADPEIRAPISAHAELGEAMDEEAPRRSRRLAIADDAQEEQVIEFAPLPVAMIPDADEAEEVTAEEPMFLPVTAEDDELELVEVDFAIEEAAHLEASDDFEPEYADAPIAAEAALEVEVAVDQDKPVAPAASPYQGKPLEELGLVQLVERLGASMQRHRAMGTPLAAAPVTTAAPQPVEKPATPQPETAQFVELEAEEALKVEAFAINTAAAAAEVDAAPGITAGEYAEFEPADEPETTLAGEEEAVEAFSEDYPDQDATAEPESQAASANPFAHFASFGVEEDEGEEELTSLADSFRLPFSKSPITQDDAEDDGADDANPSDFDESEEDWEAGYEDENEGEDEEDSDDDNEVYGSLLSLRQPFPLAGFHGRKSASEPEQDQVPAERLDQPEAELAKDDEQATTPPNPPSRDLDTEAHERALRDALLSLQRLDRAG